jgi:hypothetical protein
MNTTRRTWIAHVIAAAVLLILVATVVSQVGTNPGAVAFILVLAVTVGVGWLLATRLPRNPLGWMLIAVPGIFASTFPATLVGTAFHDVAPGVTQWLYLYGFDRQDGWIWLPAIGMLFTQIPLRFPDGKLPTPRWKWFSRYTIGSLVIGSVVFSTSPAEVAPGVPNPVYIPGQTDSLVPVAIFVLLLAPSFLGSIASLFVRYRRAGATQRTQLRWVLWAVAVVGASLMLGWLVPGDDTVNLAYQGITQTLFALIPIAIFFAVTRYRLYEIDRIISRTASYALLTVVILGVYLVIVTSVHWILPDLPSVGVALATLAAAAAFLPVLRWVQRHLDRRFDRERYNAQKVVDVFGERLRNGADPHTTPLELTAAVEQTLQPTTVGLWTRKDTP